MPSTVTNGKQLLTVVKQMEPEEFDAFLEEALASRPRHTGATLSARETKLIQRINRGMPAALSERYDQLRARLRKGALKKAEHEELLRLTHDAETRDADRATALAELAKLRRVPVRFLMKQMGITTPAIHG
jgi:hypothetical protein